MSEFDGELYERYATSVRSQIKSLRIILDSLQVSPAFKGLCVSSMSSFLIFRGLLMILVF